MIQYSSIRVTALYAFVWKIVHPVTGCNQFAPHPRLSIGLLGPLGPWSVVRVTNIQCSLYRFLIFIYFCKYLVNYGRVALVTEVFTQYPQTIIRVS